MKHKQSRGCYISLAFSIGSFGIACGSLLQMNSTSDRISLQRGLFLTSLGFLYFISLTDFFNKYFFETKHGIQFRKKYHLMVSDVMDITNKIVSAIQAAFSFLAGFIVCKSSCNKSFLYASHFLMEAYAWFGTAYFMYDIWSMYKVHTQKIADKLKTMKMTTSFKSTNETKSNGFYIKNKKEVSPNDTSTKNLTRNESSKCHGDNVKQIKWGFFKYIITHPVMVMHHIFIGTFGLLVITYFRGDFGDCVYSFIFMMEFSTPFVSIRGILSSIGLKKTNSYIFNGIFMLISFFICRILMWPYVLYSYSIAINQPFFQAIFGLPRGCKISILILFLPQIYWFYLMVRGALKVFIKPKKNERDNNDKNHEKRSPMKSLNSHTPNGIENLNLQNSTAEEKSAVQNILQGRSLM